MIVIHPMHGNLPIKRIEIWEKIRKFPYQTISNQPLNSMTKLPSLTFQQLLNLMQSIMRRCKCNFQSSANNTTYLTVEISDQL